MKRIIYFMLVLTVLFSIFGNIVSLAAEFSADDMQSSEVYTDDAGDVNFFTRIYEVYEDNRGEIFSICGSAVLLVLSLILKKDLGAIAKKIIENIAHVLSKTDLSAKNQTAIIVGLNEMVDGYEQIKEKSETVSKGLEDVIAKIQKITESNASFEAKIDNILPAIISLINMVMLQNDEVMSLLSSVYLNNRTVTDGVKEFITLKTGANEKIRKEATEIIHNIEGGAKNE